MFSIAINSGKAYVTHVCASPQGPVNPLTNLFAGVSVIDLATGTENTSPVGSAALSQLIRAQDTSVTPTSSLLGVPIAIDFKAPGIAYVVSQAGDTVQRVRYDAALTPPITLATIEIRRPTISTVAAAAAEISHRWTAYVVRNGIAPYCRTASTMPT